MTDTTAVDLLKSGDESGFTYLYNTHYSKIKAVCGQFLRDNFEAEDVTQEVFIRLIQKGPQFAGKSRVSTWLIQIALNLCKDTLRRRNCRIPAYVGSEFCPDSGQDPQTVTLRSIPSNELSALNRVILSDAWASIAEQDREAFTANVLYGYNVSAVCEMQGTKPTHRYKMNVRKARNKTRSTLKEALL